jgi:PAS domain S-box-containing protein
MQVPSPSNEVARIAALRQYQILDTPPEEAFDEIASLAAHICETPIALITFIDSDRQWFKSHVGLSFAEMPREVSFCAHTIAQPSDLFIVRDALADQRFAANPLVSGDSHIRFYAGVPLVSHDGYALGTLCVIDRVPRELAPQQLTALRALQRCVVTELELRWHIAARVRATEEEQQLSLILDTVGDVIFLLAVEPEDCFRFIAINSTFLAVTGLPREQVIGKRVEEVLPETAHALVIGKYKQAIQENKTVRWEEISEYPTGTLYGEVVVTPAWAPSGNCTHLIGSVHDITGIRRAERALRRYAERLNMLHEIDQAILAAQSAGEIARAALGRVQQLVSCQQASLTIFDYENHQAVVLAAQSDGETIIRRNTRFSLQDFKIPDQLQHGATHVIDDFTTPTMLPPALQVLRADGMRCSMAVPLRFQDDLIGMLNLAAQDPGAFRSEDIDIACEVADQLAVAIRGAQLHEAEQRARRIAVILRAANEALTLTLDLNKVLETLLDYLAQLIPYDSACVMLLTTDGLLAMHTLRGYEWWTDPEKIRAIVYDPSTTPNLQAILLTHKSYLISDTRAYPGWRHEDGAEYVRNWLGVPLMAGEQVIGIYSVDKAQPGFFTEEHVRMAEALAAQAAVAIQNARLHAQVQHYAAELELRVAQRTAALEAANKELEAFSYSVSHDLRAPLRAVSGFAQIIARRHRAALNEEGQHYVDNIVQASARMGHLIDDLLAYARLGRRSVRSQSVPLGNVLAQNAKDMTARMAETGAVLSFPDDLPTICGDPTLLGQIFANLLDNALTYRRPQVVPRITVTCQMEDSVVVVRVADNGIGIAPEQREKIFNVFQRLHSEEEYPGTGIGLSIVRKATELLGGQVWVESTVGEGSVFCVKLPLVA